MRCPAQVVCESCDGVGGHGETRRSKSHLLLLQRKRASLPAHGLCQGRSGKPVACCRGDSGKVGGNGQGSHKGKAEGETKISKKNDKLTDFDQQLIAGMEEVVAHATGAPNNCRETVIEFADAKAIRQGLRMSQSAFSRAFGIPLKTLQHREQGRHNPDRTASAYLWTIEEFHEQVREAQQRHQMRTAEIEQRSRK
jgi:DNA-binding transcriptional regulator YiaG